MSLLYARDNNLVVLNHELNRVKMDAVFTTLKSHLAAKSDIQLDRFLKTSEVLTLG